MFGGRCAGALATYPGECRNRSNVILRCAKPKTLFLSRVSASPRPLSDIRPLRPPAPPRGARPPRGVRGTGPNSRTEEYTARGRCGVGPGAGRGCGGVARGRGAWLARGVVAAPSAQPPGAGFKLQNRPAGRSPNRYRLHSVYRNQNHPRRQQRPTRRAIFAPPELYRSHAPRPTTLKIHSLKESVILLRGCGPVWTREPFVLVSRPVSRSSGLAPTVMAMKWRRLWTGDDGAGCPSKKRADLVEEVGSIAMNSWIVELPVGIRLSHAHAHRHERVRVEQMCMIGKDGTWVVVDRKRPGSQHCPAYRATEIAQALLALLAPFRDALVMKLYTARIQRR